MLDCLIQNHTAGLKGKRTILSAILILALVSFCDARWPLGNYLAKDYIITATAGPGGSITPSGEVKVKRDGKKTFTITADPGHDILDVLVDGESVGAVSRYEFTKVNETHTIEALFIIRSYTITPTAGANGRIVPSEVMLVNHGTDLEFSIIPNQGYGIEDVQVDGGSEGPINSYTFRDVSSDHSISATFMAVFGVHQVRIPNESMKIGEVIPVSITVLDDAGSPYTFISGSVGGYPLEGFQRISATTYSANFTITLGGNSYTASENIPVSNLVISNGTDLSAPYNLPLIQSGDPLDADLPEITLMQVAGGIMKIGDIIYLTIESDGLNYSIDPQSSINGIAVTESNVDFTESGGGNYVLSYIIQEGDTDVGPEYSELQATVILEKPSGNIGMPYTALTTTSELIIDAHAPQVSRLEVSGSEVGVGGTVKVVVSSDGTGYTGEPETLINGVPLSSPRVILTELSDGLYELSYLVAIEDPDVAPGELQIRIAMIDEAGNAGSSYFTLEANLLEIYTDLPEATLEGTALICEGEETELTVIFTGRSPWSFNLNGGDSIISFTNIASSPYHTTVAPVQTSLYQISTVTDVNGVENTGIGEFQVMVNELTDVEIINLAPGYNVEADPVRLEANVPGGTFSGPGVVDPPGYFYPYIADTVNSPHTIYYSFENANGCTSIASKLVHVLGAQGAILIPGSKVCGNDDPFIVSAVKDSEVNGSFRLLDSQSWPVSGLTDHGDNTASIYPDLLSPDSYTIEYQYFDGATLYLRKSFSVESVDLPRILHLDETPYCQDEAPFELQANLLNVVFEGSGVSGNMNDGFLFNPGETDPGIHLITCTATSENGCEASTQDSIVILFSPEVYFEVTTECLPEGGEIVSFNNQTSGPQSVETWSWDFGDLSSGEENQSNLMNPTHLYHEPGEKIISLTASTPDGCVATYELETIIDSRPVADFTWISDCFNKESGVKFVNRSNHGSALIDTIIWTFKTSDGDVLGKKGSIAATDTITFSFDKADRYLVDFYTMNNGGCSSELSKEIVLKPSIQLDEEGYLESFNETEGLWTVHSENQLESWVWGKPDFTGHTQENGDMAWYTLLPPWESGYDENSWIQSPCFDFSGFDQALIQMELMRSFYPYLSGAVLQYQDVIEEGWKTIGENSPGLNWYNFDNIVNKPGGSDIGWGSEVFNPDTEWVTAVHDLDQVAGKPNVVLRIAFASIGSLGMGNQGIAVNNIQLAKRSKIAVMEHFTNYTDVNSRLADDIIDALGIKHSRDLIALQYHTDSPGIDPMNENNPEPLSVRYLYYGYPPVPYSVLDGGIHSYHRYNFTELKESTVEDHLTLITLEVPAFEIDLSVDWLESGMEASTTVTCLADRFDQYVDLYLVVFETSVTAYAGPNGDSLFRNVVLDMLPATGQLLGDNWLKGNSEIRTNTWPYETYYVEDINELAVAAFIKERNGRILQAAVNYKDKTVGIPNSESTKRSLKIYPNPTQSSIDIVLGDRTQFPGRIELLDMNGRVMLSEQLPEESRIIHLNIDYLNRGIYILRWIESEQTRGISKIVKTR